MHSAAFLLVVLQFYPRVFNAWGVYLTHVGQVGKLTILGVVFYLISG